jgi:hypothetical protein
VVDLVFLCCQVGLSLLEVLLKTLLVLAQFAGVIVLLIMKYAL